MSFGFEQRLHEIPIEDLILAIGVTIVRYCEVHEAGSMLFPFIFSEPRSDEPRPISV